MSKRLPLPDELTCGQVLLEVLYYDDYFDTFAVVTHTAAPCEGQKSLVPAVLMPALTGQYGEPEEFIGLTFLVEAPEPTVGERFQLTVTTPLNMDRDQITSAIHQIIAIGQEDAAATAADEDQSEPAREWAAEAASLTITVE